ncbi:MAG: hypothetical protein ACLFOC_07725 [Campylobacterales bacterium]
MAIYSVEFFSNRSYLLEAIETIASRHNIEVETTYSKNNIYLQTHQDEELLKILGEELPISFFMGSFKNVESMPQEASFLNTKREDLGLCPRCVARVLDKECFDFMLRCSVCRNDEEDILRVEGSEQKSPEEIVKEIVKSIKNSKTVTLKNKSRDITISKDKNPTSTQILALNISQIGSEFHIGEDEAILLNSIERPVVALETKEESSLKKQGINIFDVALCADALSYIILRELALEDIKYIYVSQSTKDVFRAFSINEKRFFTTPSRAFLPYINECNRDRLSVFDRFGAQSSGGKVVVDTIEKLELVGVEEVVCSKDRSQEIEHSNKKVISDIEAVTECMKDTHDEDKLVVSSYLSLNSENSGLQLFSNERSKQIFRFASVPHDALLILEGMAQVSEKTSHLIDKYKESYKDEFSEVVQLLNNNQRYSSNLKYIFGVLGQFISPKADVDMYEHIYNMALGYRSEGGLKIDMKLSMINDSYIFDWQKSLSSILSFKLADAPKEMIAYSLFESFSDFLVDNVSEMCKQSNTKSVILSGSFLSNKIFTKRVIKHSTNIFDPKISREFPIDGASLALGGVYA